MYERYKQLQIQKRNLLEKMEKARKLTLQSMNLSVSTGEYSSFIKKHGKFMNNYSPISVYNMLFFIEQEIEDMELSVTGLSPEEEDIFKEELERLFSC